MTHLPLRLVHRPKRFSDLLLFLLVCGLLRSSIYLANPLIRLHSILTALTAVHTSVGLKRWRWQRRWRWQSIRYLASVLVQLALSLLPLLLLQPPLLLLMVLLSPRLALPLRLLLLLSQRLLLLLSSQRFLHSFFICLLDAALALFFLKALLLDKPLLL